MRYLATDYCVRTLIPVRWYVVVVVEPSPTYVTARFAASQANLPYAE